MGGGQDGMFESCLGVCGVGIGLVARQKETAVLDRPFVFVNGTVRRDCVDPLMNQEVAGRIE